MVRLLIFDSAMRVEILLLVDDDIDDQQIFAEALETVDPGINLVVASNGLEALHKLNAPGSVRPDMIFLDLNMPMMNGKEFLEEVKKTEHLENIPVIIYTTSSRPEDREQSLSLGATDFLVKPINYKLLCEQLKGILAPEGN
jgi:CheY-like chemotaxis protein